MKLHKLISAICITAMLFNLSAHEAEERKILMETKLTEATRIARLRLTAPHLPLPHMLTMKIVVVVATVYL